MSPPESPTPFRLRWYHRLWPVMAILVGLLSAWLAVGRARQERLPQSPWQVSLLAGSPEADPYTRARIALNGLLALAPTETLYYIAREDAAGRPLRARCRYRISGQAPAARWWSITAYAEDLYLFPDPGHRYSLDATDWHGSTFAFETGPTATMHDAAAGYPWLPTPGTGGLVLTLRLYRPSLALTEHPTALRAPEIHLLGGCP